MKVGLVLGGGGARGFAHLGVLRAMEERGIVPEAITGCSMGGIIGALVANGGTSKTIHTIFDELNWLKIMDRARMGALIGGNGIAAQLDRHLPDSFSELSIPLRVNAVDVQEGRAVTFWEGDLVSALRATSALPGVFSPVERDGRVFVDGGLLNNVPLGDIRTMTHAPVLAVDVTVPPNRKLVFRDNRDFWEKLKEPIRVGKRPLIFELLIKSYDIPAAALTDIQIAAFRPQILVRPKLDPDLKVEDFKRMEEAIAAGYEEATAVLNAYEDRGRNVDPS